jgi:hypothetical protein
LDWNLRGLSVTIPHKLAVIPYLDFVDATARASRCDVAGCQHALKARRRLPQVHHHWHPSPQDLDDIRRIILAGRASVETRNHSQPPHLSVISIKVQPLRHLGVSCALISIRTRLEGLCSDCF